MTVTSYQSKIETIVSYLKKVIPADFVPDIAVVCGSGLSGLSDIIEDPIVVPYSEIPEFPESTVAGHGNALVFGTLGGRRVVVQKGRFHFYEGYSMQIVTIAIRVFAAMGSRVIIVTNAAGGVNPNFNVGDIMVINDQISIPCMSGNNPLVGHNNVIFGPRFPPVNGIYNPNLQEVFVNTPVARSLGDIMRSGTYFHVSGPNYESPSEIGFIRQSGGDAVGMSTAPEVIIAAHSGVAVLGLSLITNKCIAPGDIAIPPSHEEVLIATKSSAEKLQSLVAEFIRSVDVSTFPTSMAYDHFNPIAY